MLADPHHHRTLARVFGDLKVRPKLMVLHNFFFLILACAAYFTLIPLFERQVAEARNRELALVRQILSSNLPIAEVQALEFYGFREGPADQIVPDKNLRERLDSNPDQILNDGAGRLFRKAAAPGIYRLVETHQAAYNQLVERAQLTLFIVLGAIYLLAVLVLESAIMPLYVYGPLRLLLDADQATHQGDRDNELIPDNLILGDEIGQIMRSRNATVSELRQHEDNLAAALRRLEEQDRLASLGLLSASVAHELNTPLAVLHGSIEKLLETTKDPHTLDRLSRMERVTQRLRKISESLVDFVRQRKQHMEHVNLRPLVDEAWGLVAIDERASEVSFRNDVRAEEAITGNADRLVQVFVNLLRNAMNAVKSSGEHGPAEIRVCSKPLAWNGRSWISITVEDNGPGIPAEVLPDIFEAFVTTRLDARGTGLGLTVTEGIVTQHGGVISASNRPQGGASIEMRFPAPARAVVVSAVPAAGKERSVSL